MKPNIFDLATKELTQDAFITWLLQWADQENAIHDTHLNKCGVDFVKSLIKKEIPDFNEEITKVVAGRQWENIDVWAEVNNKYLIIIEDKTNTYQHSDQLPKYRSIAEKWCSEQSPCFNTPICIYLKTGNESVRSLEVVKKEGYKIYNRKDFLNLLQIHTEVKSDIYIDFTSRLSKIERNNNLWENKILNKWNGDDWQGFFQFLESEMKIVNWHYVNNPNGGFWNAVISWEENENFPVPVYIQAEETKLCIKISTDEVELPVNSSRGQMRDEIHNLILKKAKNANIEGIRRPDRFGNGKYMTVAVISPEYWIGDPATTIDKAKVVNQLKSFRLFLKETVASTSTN